MKIKTTRIFTITIAILAVVILCMMGGLSVGASTDSTEAEHDDTLSLMLDMYRTYHIYPDGYVAGYNSMEPFSGTYILTGSPDEDIMFESYGEPVTYNVIIHNLNAVSSMWYGMLGVDPNVTLNLTVYGDNSLIGYNHPGIKVNPEKEGAAPVVNIKMTDGSRLTVGSSYSETTTCIASGVTLTLTNGVSDIDMSEEGWQNNKRITFSNGDEYTHKTSYVYVDEDKCVYQCNKCSAVEGLYQSHGIENAILDLEHPDYALKHNKYCYYCNHEFGAADHYIKYEHNEDTHTAYCNECGYESEEAAHSMDENSCTVCDASYSYKLEADGKATYIFLTETLNGILGESGGKVTLLQNVDEIFGKTLTISNDTEIDLAGKAMYNVSFNVTADAKLKITDSDPNKGGSFESASYYPTSVYGALTLDGINTGSLNITLHDSSALVINNVDCSSRLFVYMNKASVAIDGLTCSGALVLTLGVYLSEVEIDIDNVKLKKLSFDSDHNQDIKVNMLLPDGYAFSGTDGIIDGSGTEISDVTAITPHPEHNSDKYQFNSATHWISCTCGHAENAINEPHTPDENNTCVTCGAKLVATLTANGATVYHASLVDALLETNNYSESTVTLIDYFSPNSYLEISLKSKVILDLNGYTYHLNGRLRIFKDLTIIDSSADQTGKMHSGGDISYIMEFYKGSQVTIDGGEYFGLIYGALYNSETATITVNGGRFIGEEKFRLNKGTTIIVNGGVFECASSVFNFTWSSEVKYEINGGIFINSRVFYTNENNLPVLEDVLGASGECELGFISSAGDVLTIEDLCEYYEGEIFVFHKNNTNGFATDDYHGLFCDTCSSKTATLPHTDSFVPNEDGSAHTVKCLYCQWTLRTEDHVHDNACDSECNVCGGIRTVPDHVYDNACDSECNVCEDARTVPDHVYDNACDSECNECKDVRTVPDHNYLSGECALCGGADPNAQGSSSEGSGSGSTPGTDASGEGDSGSKDSDTTNGGVGIALIVIGSVIAVGGAAIAVYFIRKKKILKDK